ncbi:MAG: hypothetical protein RBU30_03705 [Polyangia bacterium]|jgi:hypothetical protein|nr:hypothetical protein [Polyangia bacterium]
MPNETIQAIDAKIKKYEKELATLRQVREIFLRDVEGTGGSASSNAVQTLHWPDVAMEIIRGYGVAQFKKSKLVDDLSERGVMVDPRNVATWLSRNAKGEHPKFRLQGRHWILIQK